MLSVCFRHKISPVRLASVDTVLSRSLAKCAKHGISVIFFCISLKSSSSLSVRFHLDFVRVFVSFGQFFPKFREKILQGIALLREMILILYMMPVVLIVIQLLAFPCSVLIGNWLSRVPAYLVFLVKNLDFFSLAQYPVPWSFFSFLKVFSRIVSLSSFVTIFILSSPPDV